MVVFGSFLIAGLCFLLDISFLKNFGINPLFPVFSLAFFVILSSKDKSYWSLIIAILLGLLLDGSGLSNLPVYLVVFSIIYITNRYFVAGVLSYGQTKQSLITLAISIIVILAFNYENIYKSISVSRLYIFDILISVIYLIGVFYLLRILFNKYFESFEKYLAERFR